MLGELRPAAALLALFTGLCGLAYPLAVTALGRIVFPDQARGSLVTVEGRTRGSDLVGQAFSAPDRFWSRPSATARFPYDAAASTGTNLGPWAGVEASGMHVRPSWPDRGRFICDARSCHARAAASWAGALAFSDASVNL